MRNRSNWIRVFVLLMLILLIVMACIDYRILERKFLHFLSWMEESANNVCVGSLLLVVIFLISNVILIPTSLLILGSGFVYVHVFGWIAGVTFSSILVWLGQCIGATLSFLNGRYLLRNVVSHCTAKSRRFLIIEQIVEQNGFKVVLLLRLSPIVPYNLFNPFMGVTSVSLKDYSLAHIGMIPECICFSIFGGTIAHIYQLTQSQSATRTIVILSCVGAAMTLCVVCYISRKAKQKFNELAQQSVADNTEVEMLVDHHDGKNTETETHAATRRT